MVMTKKSITKLNDDDEVENDEVKTKVKDLWRMKHKVKRNFVENFANAEELLPISKWAELVTWW